MSNNNNTTASVASTSTDRQDGISQQDNTTDATCIICTDSKPIQETATIASTNSRICRTCLTGIFTNVMAKEHYHPPMWGRIVLDPRQFSNLLGSDFVKKYHEKVWEYQLPPDRRIYCTNRVPIPNIGSATEPYSVLCETFVGACVTDDDHTEPDGETTQRCKSCNCVYCTYCGEVYSTTGQRHICEPSKRKEEDEKAFEQLVKGKDYQICPLPSCQRKVQLQDGCNHVSCKCGKGFCFICGRPATADSGHWNGSREAGGCPRYNHPSNRNAMWDRQPEDGPPARNRLQRPDNQLLIRGFGGGGTRGGRGNADDASPVITQAAVWQRLRQDGEAEVETLYRRDGRRHEPNMFGYQPISPAPAPPQGRSGGDLSHARSLQGLWADNEDREALSGPPPTANNAGRTRFRQPDTTSFGFANSQLAMGHRRFRRSQTGLAPVAAIGLMVIPPVDSTSRARPGSTRPYMPTIRTGDNINDDDVASEPILNGPPQGIPSRAETSPRAANLSADDYAPEYFAPISPTLSPQEWLWLPHAPPLQSSPIRDESMAMHPMPAPSEMERSGFPQPTTTSPNHDASMTYGRPPGDGAQAMSPDGAISDPNGTEALYRLLGARQVVFGPHPESRAGNASGRAVAPEVNERPDNHMRAEAPCEYPQHLRLLTDYEQYRQQQAVRANHTTDDAPEDQVVDATGLGDDHRQAVRRRLNDWMERVGRRLEAGNERMAGLLATQGQSESGRRHTDQDDENEDADHEEHEVADEAGDGGDELADWPGLIEQEPEFYA